VLLSLDYSRVVAALEDRIQFLIRKYPKVPEESVRFLSKCDPSDGKYVEYLVAQRSKGTLINEDTDNTCWFVSHALEFFMMVNQSKKIKEHLQAIFSDLDVPSEVFQINIKDLYRLAVAHYDDVKREFNRFTKKKQAGKVIYQDNTYKIIALGWDPSSPQVSWEDVIDEICAYGKGKWCTQHKESAEDYLSSGGLYIVFKNGKSLLQTDGREFKDVVNHNFDFSDFSDLALILMKVGIIYLLKAGPYSQESNRKELNRLYYYHNLNYNSGPVGEYLKENHLI
jgi:hypothetical protein